MTTTTDEPMLRAAAPDDVEAAPRWHDPGPLPPLREGARLVKRRRSAGLAAAVAALLATACGGSASPTRPTPDNPAIVTLDSSNFDAVVLGSPRPCLVEFHNPT